MSDHFEPDLHSDKLGPGDSTSGRAYTFLCMRPWVQVLVPAGRAPCKGLQKAQDQPFTPGLGTPRSSSPRLTEKQISTAMCSLSHWVQSSALHRSEMRAVFFSLSLYACLIKVNEYLATKWTPVLPNCEGGVRQGMAEAQELESHPNPHLLQA